VKLPAEISFNEHIQPILSEYCYHCHGPDSGTRMPKDAPLRLDRSEDAFALRDDGKPPIIKGKPAESLIVHLIKSKDPDEIMPPAESHKVMKPGEIALLEKWIAQGAKYEPHWAFAVNKHPEPPAAGEGWAVNPIDRFIAAKLDAAGLKPNPPEDARRFHRRLTFDLTGLPPSPAETDTFVKAHAANPQDAVNAEADRLLGSDASAEHLARHWLDSVRYADTHGIHIDNYRNIWPYRDWVLQAFRANMPWDQFTVEQMAGDLLPNATLEQKIASGYNRCMATTGEGGAISEEYFSIYAKDQVETMGAVWLGLTPGCAACHDHKFDPISTKEFYQLTAFFRNTTMSALDGNNASHPPVVLAPLKEDRPVLAAIEKDLEDSKTKLTERVQYGRRDFEAWLASPTKAAADVAQGINQGLALSIPLTEDQGAIRGVVYGQAREWTAKADRKPALVGSAVVASGTPVELGNDLGSLETTKPFTLSAFIRVDGTPRGAIISRMDVSQAYRGWDIWMENGLIGAHLIDQWPDKAIKLMSEKPVPTGQWIHVALTCEPGKPAKEIYRLWINGEQVKTTSEPNGPVATLQNAVPLRIGTRSNDNMQLSGGEVLLQDFRIYQRAISQVELKKLSKDAVIQPLIALPAAKRKPEQIESLYQFYLANHDNASKQLRDHVADLTKQQQEIRARGSNTLVMEEKKNSEPFAHVLTRGVYSDKGEKVTPGTLAVLPPMAPDSPKNRLGLARWLADPANPLPARVTMNRTWQYFFGTGIVETTEDFGIMGARPSHPQLLDWLAAGFVDSKWNYRHMLKQIVTSATYRQSAANSPEKLEKDPGNRLLSRGPRIRLDAEQLRDMALFSSSLLVPKTGGPSVKPYQPEGIWEAVAMKESNTKNYKQGEGDDLYRRSMYTLWKRTAAPPSMEIFNAPSRESFCVRRERTNTPLQALVLLNDPQFVEASRVLATHAMQSAKEFGPRLAFISSRLLARELKTEELAIVKSTYDKSLTTYKNKPADAKSFIATGNSPVAGDLDPAELAAWTLVASQLLNLDETVTR
jgi:hypothetical protein